MSADNTIFILKDSKATYRVAMVFNAEELTTDNREKIFLDFSKSKVYNYYNQARSVAIDMEKDAGYVEYGISEMELHYPFPQAKAEGDVLDILSKYVLHGFISLHYSWLPLIWDYRDNKHFYILEGDYGTDLKIALTDAGLVTGAKVSNLVVR